jgi:ribosomal-protein-alanine N-acetyltransferase
MMPMGRTAEIRTARLRMRPWTLGDVDELHRLWTDPDVRRYLWDDEVISRERAVAEIERSIEDFRRDGFGEWVVISKPERLVIGFCGYRRLDDPPGVELMYGLAPSHWHRGLATEAARAVLRWGFEAHGFERVYAGADPPNAASLRVMKRLGMTFEARRFIQGQEAVYYGISRDAFRGGGSPRSDARDGTRE